MKRTALDIQAEGLTELNKYTVEILNHIIPQMKKLIGIKILTQQGKSKKWNVTGYEKENVKDVKENVKGENKFITYSYYLDFSGSSIWLKSRVCINGGSYDITPANAYCEYLENNIYIGAMQPNDNYTLAEVKEIEAIEHDCKLNESFTEVQLNNLVKQFEVAKDTARDLYNKIPASVKKAKFLSF